jgi:hypothetical protein
MVQTKIISSMYYVYFHIYVACAYLFLRSYTYIRQLLARGKKEETIKIKDVNLEHIEQNTKKFLQWIENPSLVLNQRRITPTEVDLYSSGSMADEAFNKNIDSVFYSKKEFQTMIQEENNILEKEWKTRILFENTPRGNVIMHYNPYKLGFTYYADQYIPYDMLNVVAMKYVRIYKCLDFFMDELVLPETRKSPLLLLNQEDKKEVLKTDKPEGDEEFKHKLKNAPFAKLKSYKLTGKKDSKDSKDNKDDLLKVRNRFIHMGKCCNYSFLNIPEKKKVSLFSNSELVSNLIENLSVQQEVFSYRNFKKSVLTKGQIVVCTDVNVATL